MKNAIIYALQGLIYRGRRLERIERDISDIRELLQMSIFRAHLTDHFESAAQTLPKK